MAKRFRLQLTEETTSQTDPEIVRVRLEGEAASIVTWLLSIAHTVVRDDADAVETLYRQAVVLTQELERLRRVHGTAGARDGG